jgi:putative membrane protein
MLTRVRSSGEPRVAVVAYLVMVVGMVATPLFARGSDERRILAVVVVGGLFVTAISSMRRIYGIRAILAASAIIVVGLIVEVVGSSTGFPFGEYDYTGVLTPQLFGVPIVVAFAWAGITLTVHGALHALPLGRAAKAQAARIAVMAFAITAWDLFLDPQMVAEGYWSWQPSTLAFREIPIVNYLGWLFTATITSAVAVLFCKPVHAAAPSLPRLTYATLATLSTVGFLIFFDDPVVALVGGPAMGAFVALSFGTFRKTTR